MKWVALSSLMSRKWKISTLLDASVEKYKAFSSRVLNIKSRTFVSPFCCSTSTERPPPIDFRCTYWCAASWQLALQITQLGWGSNMRNVYSANSWDLRVNFRMESEPSFPKVQLLAITIRLFVVVFCHICKGFVFWQLQGFSFVPLLLYILFFAQLLVF